MANLLNGIGCKLFIVNVRLDLLDHSVWNVVLVVVKQALEELGRFLQHVLANVPVVVHLCADLLSSHLLGLNLLHDADCLND